MANHQRAVGTMYIYGKCSTCKQAVRFLEEQKIVCEIKEITLEPPSVVELQKMLNFQQGNLKKLFNTSGQLYREMQISDKWDQMSPDAALSLLSKHGMLVKRPFLIGKDFGLVGFHENQWRDTLGSIL
jgi:arsenate reductase (glutaredoxin)